MVYKEAVDLSILKWQYIVDHDGSNIGLCVKIPELLKMEFGCGLCEFHKRTDKLYPNCPECDLYRLDGNRTCSTEGSTHNYWAEHKTKKSAKAVLNLIRQIKV